MNPNGGEKAPQSVEYAAEQPGANETEGKALEAGKVSSPENSPQKQSVQASSQLANDLAAPASSSAVGPPADDNQSASLSSSAQTKANDGDRIEKEWIDKAKAVISKTQDDPFEQKEAMSQVKADYIKKRFNKTLKTDSSGR